MTLLLKSPDPPLPPPAPLPGWIVGRGGESPEDQAFFAGAALAHLHGLQGRPDLPQALWRARLALAAAERGGSLIGRLERRAEMRDAVHLRRPGDPPGPAGELLLSWSRAVDRPLSVASLVRALPGRSAEEIATWLDRGGDAGTAGAPVGQAALVLEAVLTEAPRAEVAALILADAALAQRLGGTHLVPLLGTVLRSADLRLRGDALRQACYRRLPEAVRGAVQGAADLTRRAARLQAVAPKLRAKGADRAVALFLTCDALAPAALTGLMSDRAARRLCDRLVELDAIRELTGRDSFRLYGV